MYRFRSIFLAALAATALAAGSSMAGSPATALSQANVPTYVMVQLSNTPTMARYQQVAVASGKASAQSVAVSQLAAVSSEQAAFGQAVATANLPVAGIKEIYRVQRVLNGIVYQTDLRNLAALRALPGVTSVTVLRPKVTDNGHTVPFINVPALWSRPTSPLHGENVKVGVIDTGIDYTHANFGGPGTVEAYSANDKNIIENDANGAPTFPTAKVVGGYDFAGANYDANSTSTSTPTPDADPLDGAAHGSHVAGSVAGYGVNTDGTTYAGAYDSTLDTTTLRIGPGAAPKASLYALKVFGDHGGSTVLATAALEWAVDPNGDGNPADHLDVVNLSLGSPYGNSDDNEGNELQQVIYANAVKAGVVVVASAGNSSDFYFTTGDPAATPEVISVAATSVGDSAGLRVNSPAAIAGVKTQGSGSPAVAAITPVTGNVVATVPAIGCNAQGVAQIDNAAQIAGNIALIQRGVCTFAVKTDAAAAAGAIAVIVYNPSSRATEAPPNMALDGTLTIPSRSLTATSIPGEEAPWRD